jgi:glycosyltransferase involved in cell wall biosynthesis
MRVSIIIPVYNAEKYIQECIESALNQTYPDIEVIAVNDGSKDNSLKILEQYSNKIRIISKENGGTASALNVGIKTMTGEWFKWLSADDVLYPNAVEELILAAKSLPNRKFILYSNYEIIDSDGKIMNTVIESNYNKLDLFNLNVILLDHFIGNGTTSLIHKSTIEECGMFNENIGYKEDYELWLRFCVLCNCGLYLVPKVLAKYRKHEKQLTKEKLEVSLFQSNQIQDMIFDSISLEEQRKYKKSLREYQRNRPILIRSRHMLRDIIFKIFPKSVSYTILRYYMNRKK